MSQNRSIVLVPILGLMLSGCTMLERPAASDPVYTAAPAPQFADQSGEGQITAVSPGDGFSTVHADGTMSPAPAEPIEFEQVDITEALVRERSPLEWGSHEADAAAWDDRPGLAPADSRAEVIGLYGEVYGSTDESGRPFDGSANLIQASFATEGACFDPAVDPRGALIAFASTMHSDRADIYYKSTTGRTLTQLTADPADDVMPCFSPDGRQIAFASNRGGTWNVYVQALDGSPAVQITSENEPALHPSWSPDGTRIAYCKLGGTSGRWELWVMDVRREGVRQFLDYGMFPQWSPDVRDSKILFQRARQRGSRYHSVWTLDYVNGDAVRPTEIISAANAAAINPSWSADGRRIVFATVVEPEYDTDQRPTQSDIWVVHADGTNRTNLTQGRAANYQPVWSPDGTVYFVSDRSGVDNIWSVATRRAPNLTGPGAEIATVDPSTAQAESE